MTDREAFIPLRENDGKKITDFRRVLTGTLIVFPLGVELPAELLPCDGGPSRRNEEPELFAVIGTAFGEPNNDHFSRPDLRPQNVGVARADFDW